ncbi:gfo/Idh/MocA family oxidoreductase [bacterium]|nr:gfo/Idh/MocA family oxidoreductase [bacterium]
MIGGGEGAFIGAVHRTAMRITGAYDLVCGAFSSDPARSRASGAAIGIDPARAYPDFERMIAAEAALPPAERMQAVVIVTPNHLHLKASAAALDAGFDVICDKPAARTLGEARELRDHVRASGRLFVLTHTYLGYPLVRQARELVASGAIGPVRRVYVEYTQGWLARPEEAGGQKQAAWRTDPDLSGPSGCYGDIGSHAHNLAEYVAGQRVTELLTELAVQVPGRRLDDDGASLLRFESGARGVLTASQICPGEENALRLRVYGETGGLDWRQEEPNTLWLKPIDGPAQRWRAGGNVAYLAPDVAAEFRTPAGHPEGYLEAFATLYTRAAEAIRSGSSAPMSPHLPGIDAGVRGMAFIDAALRSSAAGGKWTALDAN